MADTPGVHPAPCLPLADGQQQGLHWWLERLPCGAAQLTVTGHDAMGGYVSWHGVVDVPTPASVRRQVAELEADALARMNAKVARKAARAAG